MDSKVTSN